MSESITDQLHRAERAARHELARADLLEYQVSSRQAEIRRLEQEVRTIKASRRAVLELESRTRAECNRLRGQVKELRDLLESTRRFNLGSPDGIPDTWFIKRDKALDSTKP